MFRSRRSRFSRLEEMRREKILETVLMLLGFALCMGVIAMVARYENGLWWR